MLNIRGSVALREETQSKLRAISVLGPHFLGVPGGPREGERLCGFPHPLGVDGERHEDEEEDRGERRGDDPGHPGVRAVQSQSPGCSCGTYRFNVGQLDTM